MRIYCFGAPPLSNISHTTHVNMCQLIHIVPLRSCDLHGLLSAFRVSTAAVRWVAVAEGVGVGLTVRPLCLSAAMKTPSQVTGAALGGIFPRPLRTAAGRIYAAAGRGSNLDVLPLAYL